MHELIINNFWLKSEGLVEVDLSIDCESISFLISKEELGYKVPGALENLMTENLKRSGMLGFILQPNLQFICLLEQCSISVSWWRDRKASW